MIPIEQITEQELEKRYSVLSGKLKDSLESAAPLRVVDQVTKNHHLLDEEKVLMVRQIVAVTLFGFIHPYDVASEINEALELHNPKLAESIAKELDAKIFQPLKSDLDVNYQPLPEVPAAVPRPVEPAPASVAPRIVEEVKPSGALPVAPAAPTKIRDLSQVTQPKPLSEILAKQPPPEASLRPTSPPAPQPFIIHREIEVEPLKPKAELTIKLPSQTFEGIKPAPPPQKPATIEMGPPPESRPKAPSIARTEVSAPRVVHYTQFRTPLGARPEAARKPGEPPAPVPLSEISMAPLGTAGGPKVPPTTPLAAKTAPLPEKPPLVRGNVVDLNKMFLKPTEPGEWAKPAPAPPPQPRPPQGGSVPLPPQSPLAPPAPPPQPSAGESPQSSAPAAGRPPTLPIKPEGPVKPGGIVDLSKL